MQGPPVNRKKEDNMLKSANQSKGKNWEKVVSDDTRKNKREMTTSFSNMIQQLWRVSGHGKKGFKFLTWP